MISRYAFTVSIIFIWGCFDTASPARGSMQASTAPSLRIEIEAAIVYNFLCVVKADYKNILDEED